jgi:hypothetical protein
MDGLAKEDEMGESDDGLTLGEMDGLAKNDDGLAIGKSVSVAVSICTATMRERNNGSSKTKNCELVEF